MLFAHAPRPRRRDRIRDARPTGTSQEAAMHTRAIIATLAIFSSIVWAAEYPVVQGKTYKFEKIAEGVYYATGGFGSNNVVIVNDTDVMLVDDGTTPATA